MKRLNWPGVRWANERIAKLEAENQRLRDARLTYQQAKKAVELFDDEWIGQDAKRLWDWALEQVLEKGGEK